MLGHCGCERYVFDGRPAITYAGDFAGEGLHCQKKPSWTALGGQKLVLAPTWVFVSKHLNFEWCPEQPCLARNEHCCIMVHVDDILFLWQPWPYWNQTFLSKFAETFKISSSVLQGVASEINFLKRKIRRLEHGLALLPGTSAEKVVQLFEQQFGKVRPQAIPCDGGIQTEDRSDELAPKDAFGYRSVVGTCLYLARDRPDLLFTGERAQWSYVTTHMYCPAKTSKAGWVPQSNAQLLCFAGDSNRGVKGSGIQPISFGCWRV